MAEEIQNFIDPTQLSPDVLWKLLAIMSRTEPLVQRVMEAQKRDGFTREHAALALAYVLGQEMITMRQKAVEALRTKPFLTTKRI